MTRKWSTREDGRPRAGVTAHGSATHELGTTMDLTIPTPRLTATIYQRVAQSSFTSRRHSRCLPATVLTPFTLRDTSKWLTTSALPPASQRAPNGRHHERHHERHNDRQLSPILSGLCTSVVVKVLAARHLPASQELRSPGAPPPTACRCGLRDCDPRSSQTSSLQAASSETLGVNPATYASSVSLYIRASVVTFTSLMTSSSWPCPS